MKIIYHIAVVGLLTLLVGCETSKSGVVRIFPVKHENNQLTTWDESDFNEKRAPLPVMGDPIQFDSDVVTIYVEDVFINHVPTTLTNSRDVLVICDVWENSVTSLSSKPLTSVVYAGKNVIVPGRLNFKDKIAYGPTKFKGYPLQVRFTILVLQKDRTERASDTVSIAENLINSAGPQYSLITSAAAAMLRDVLKAQPDVTAFEFDAVFSSFSPAKLQTPLNDIIGQPSGQNDEEATLKKALFQGLELSPDDSQTILDNLKSYKDTHDQLSKSPGVRYGKYALVETTSRKSKNKTEYEAFSKRKLSIIHEADYLWHSISEQSRVKVDTNYIVFRIEPSQLSQTEEILRVASVKNQEIIETLRRSSEDINTAVQSATNTATKLKSDIYEINLSRLAQEAASAKTFLEFENKYKELAKVNFNDNNIVDNNIYKKVLVEWKSKYEATAGAR